MKTLPPTLSRIVPQGLLRLLARLGLACFLPLASTAALAAPAPAQTFATPEDAVAALVNAASARDTNALRTLFGPAFEDVVNPDQVQAGNDLAEFTMAAQQARGIRYASDTSCVLHIGETSWPFPIPMVKKDGRWFFDLEAGKDELLNRRIGDNELSTLETMRAYVEAQREYAARDRDADGVLEYAQRIRSTPGTKDGLYWSPDLDGEISPLGPHAAQAQAHGYFKGGIDKEGASSEPFRGYLFRILTRQGRSAPGGKYDYIINGNMIGGFALVAWPAEYGNSGIMTFIVSHQGRVYQKDLGPHTAKAAARLGGYNPDGTWTLSPD